MKHSGYFTRAVKARDPRFARIFGKMGYDTTALMVVDAVEIAPPASAPHPLDHDGDGQKGGSNPADERGEDVEALRAAYAVQKCEEADRRWGAARLKRELGIEG